MVNLVAQQKPHELIRGNLSRLLRRRVEGHGAIELRAGIAERRDDLARYLIELCGLNWNAQSKKYTPYKI